MLESAGGTAGDGDDREGMDATLTLRGWVAFLHVCAESW